MSEAVQGFVWNLVGAAIIVVLLLMVFMGMARRRDHRSGRYY